MKNYNEKERSCEATFFSARPYWHAYTSGKETPILFTGSDELRFAMNVIAQAADKFPELRIIAFEVMNNHFHFVISGSESVIQAFFEFIRRRISRSITGIKKAKLTIKPIKDLQSLRNNIIYTNRNGYVADPNYTPFNPLGNRQIRHILRGGSQLHTVQLSLGNRRLLLHTISTGKNIFRALHRTKTKDVQRSCT